MRPLDGSCAAMPRGEVGPGEVGPAEKSAPEELGPISRRTRPPAVGELGPLAGELSPIVWQSDMAWHCYVFSIFRLILNKLWH